MYSRLAPLSAIVLVCCAATQLNAAFLLALDVDIVPNVDLFKYTYSLSVDPASTFTATDFSLDVSPASHIQAITSPAEWTAIYAPGDPFIYWFAPFDGSQDVLPGTSASFSFLSSFSPDLQAYSSFGIDPNAFESDLVDGLVDSPSTPPSTGAVPEPGSLALWSLGTLGLALFARRRSGPPQLAPLARRGCCSNPSITHSGRRK